MIFPFNIVVRQDDYVTNTEIESNKLNVTSVVPLQLCSRREDATHYHVNLTL